MRNKLLILTILLFALSPFVVGAADFRFQSEKDSFGIGEEFIVDLIIDTKDDQINASQATIKFQSNILELLEVNKNSSIFNFWVEGPTVSNENGSLVFIGGTSNGLIGDNLQVFKLKFKTKGAGNANLSITDAVITASDGKGTNILNSIEEKSIKVGTQIVSTKVVEPEFNPAEVVVSKPQQIVRNAVRATNLPIAPKVVVPIYPDQEKWYKHVSDITVLWEVPDDVVQVAVEVDQNPNTEPRKAEANLFNGKDIGSLEEGIWYVHVQFKNNIGWGETTHYKISIDKTKPLPFNIEIYDEVSDNPSPRLIFETQDALSGILYASILVDGVEVLQATTTEVIIPPQKPGVHELTIKVFDKARNVSSNSASFEIIPLPTPVINFLSDSISSGEILFVSGKSIPDIFIDILIFNKSGAEIYSGSYNSDGSGNWEAIIEGGFATGKYSLMANARDNRGAISFATEAETFKIKPQVIISLGFIELGWFEIFVILVLLVLSIMAIYGWYYVEEQNKRKAYQIIAIRDVKKMTNLLDRDVNEVKNYIKKQQSVMHSQVYGEVSHLLEILSETSAKMKKYLGQELDDLK